MAQNAAQTAYSNAMNKINMQRGGLLNQYGYRMGAGGALEVDPNNQFGKFQQMMRTEAGANDQARFAQRASGFGGSSGYLQHALSLLGQRNAAEHGQLGLGLQTGLNDLTGQELDAKDNFNNALANAQLAQTQAAIQQGAFNPADLSGIDVPYPSEPAANPMPSLQAKAIKGNTVLWGGQYRNATQMKNWLASRKLNVNTWAKNHPDAAKALGL